MSEQQLLRDVGTPCEPPVCYKHEQVGPVYVMSKGEIYPGYVGNILNRDQFGFVGFRRHEDHYHRKMEAYMLSDTVLAELRELGVQLVLIAEEDTNRVYEWHISQFQESVPQHAKGSDEKDEDQTFVKVDDAWGTFDDHSGDVLIGEREVN